MPPRTEIDRFVRALHRRVVVLRAAECAGIGLAVGAGVVVMVGVLLVWRGQSPVLPGAMLLAGGAAVGLAWGGVRRPGRLWAAMEADRQLRLNDLLATAWAMPDGNDPWLDAVVAMAGEQVRRYGPRQVILHHLGVRAWGGIASAVLLAGALMVFSTQSPATQASATGFVAPDQLDALTTVPRPAGVPGQVQFDPSQPTTATFGRDAQPARTVSRLTPATASDTAEASAEISDAASPVANQDGAGSGAGRTDSADGAAPHIADASVERDPAIARGDAGTPARAGAGARTPTAAISDSPDASGTAVGSPQDSAPWNADTWSARRADAMRSIDAAPAQYRDLMRAYFSTSPIQGSAE